MSDLQHVAFIPDGNRRFGRAELGDATLGHQAGTKTVETIVAELKAQGIRYATFYIFSTENWQRSTAEVDFLMELFVQYFGEREEIKTRYKDDRVAIRFIGRRDRVPRAVREALEHVEQETATTDPTLTITFALDYGGRDELVRVVRRLLWRIVTFRQNPFRVTDATLTGLLDTAGVPPPDLVIRTSGEQRLSGFLLWQAAYAELYFASVPWPAFDAAALRTALDWYRTRERRFGGDSGAV
jgi:undecaprenyl diphosphate synthase